MALSEDFIEEVRLSNDIVDVISGYVRLEKKGKYYFGLCPFHKEKTASFSVTPSLQIFYCYSCQRGGNVIQFIREAENLDYIESVKFLADRARIDMPHDNNEKYKETIRIKKEILKINTTAARFFHEQLNRKENSYAMEYLKERNLSENTIRKFGIGYSLKEWDALNKYLLERGYHQELILKSGLVIPNKKGGYYDRFRGRVMFPIFDIRGDIIAFGGRVTDASMPKYLNSPESCVYSKGKNLYALNFVKQAKPKRIIIVEGYMDVITLHQFGIINTVASLGTALTDSQGRLLKKYSEEVIISYDTDTAGRSATMKGLDLLNEMGANVKVLTVDDGKDPDEYIIKNGVENFKKHIENSVSLLEYKVHVLKQEIDTTSTEGKIKFLNKVADVLAKIENNVEREMYVKKLADEYHITEESLFIEIYKRMKTKGGTKKNLIKPKALTNGGFEKEEAVSDKKNIYHERILLSLLVDDNSIYNLVKDRIKSSEFEEVNQKAAQVVFEKIEGGKGIVPVELLNDLEGEILGEFARIFKEDLVFENNKKAIMDIISKLEINKLNKRQNEIVTVLSKGEKLSNEDRDKFIKELNMILTRKKR